MLLKDAFIQSMHEAFLWCKINCEYRNEIERGSLSSAEQVNILIGFTESLKGNAIFGFAKPTAIKIASFINGKEISTLDYKIKSHLGEITRFVVELALSKSQKMNTVSLSPPIIITGDNIFLMISRMKTIQMNFSLDEEPVSLTYYIE